MKTSDVRRITGGISRLLRNSSILPHDPPVIPPQDGNKYPVINGERLIWIGKMMVIDVTPRKRELCH